MKLTNKYLKTKIAKSLTSVALSHLLYGKGERNKMEIISITYNWYYTTQEGEEYDKYEIGNKNVKKITEHKPQGEGDNWYCDVEFNDGKIITVTNLNKITRKPLSV